MFRGNAIDGARKIEQYRQLNNFQQHRQQIHPQIHPQIHSKINYRQHQSSPYKQPSNIYEGFENDKSKSNNSDITCQQVLKHISNCPICSKFYNNDRTVYIIIIVILIIISLLLFKKVLDV